MSSNIDIVRKYWEFEAKKDLDGIMSCYHSDATFKAPICEQLQGAEALRSFYKGLLEGDTKAHVEITRSTDEGERVAVEFILHFDMGGGKKGEMYGCNVFTVRDGKFQNVRSYFDPSDFDV